MAEAQGQPTPQPPRSPRDRWFKRILVLLILAVVVAVYVHQMKGGAGLLDRWGKDLDKALRAAQEQGKPLAVFFMPRRYSKDDATDKMVFLLNNKAGKALGKYVCVAVFVEDLNVGPAKTYGVGKLPALVVLSSAGTKADIRQGELGEQELSDFLNESAKRLTTGSAPGTP